MKTDTKFQELFGRIATRKNFIEPHYPQSTWSVDLYEADDWFAGMSDAGYCRYVGRKVNGKVAWRVDEIYGKPYRFDSITEEEFLTV